MDKYSDVNVDISKATVKKLLGQLWYLSVELIPLCLFDRNVAIETKRKISQTLKEHDDADDEGRKELFFTRKISCAENWKISHLREAEVFLMYCI